MTKAADAAQMLLRSPHAHIRCPGKGSAFYADWVAGLDAQVTTTHQPMISCYQGICIIHNAYSWPLATESPTVPPIC